MASAAVQRWCDAFDLRIPVTIETPVHGERLGAEDSAHALDIAVTALAGDAVADVGRVIEEDEVGQIVHAAPRDRSAVVEAPSHRLQQGRVAPDLAVTTHAQCRGRNASVRRALRLV